MRNSNLLRYLNLYRDIDRRPLLLQVATAVAYLHEECKLIHGDIKCEHVLVTDDGKVALGDFGLSTFMEETGSRTITGVRQTMTLHFAARELILVPDDEMERPARKSTQTDVYAFAMTLIQAFTLRPPCFLTRPARSFLNCLAMKFLLVQRPGIPQLVSVTSGGRCAFSAGTPIHRGGPQWLPF